MFARLFTSLVAVMALCNVAVAAKPPKSVFAHFMVGNAQSFTPATWASNIAQAQAAGIDGFALNCGPQDSYTHTQLALAYTAADAVGFKLFISFDYASSGAWPAQTVINYINEFKSHPSQFSVGGAPFVSTFEGMGSAGDWTGIRAATGCYFVPDWTSQGPAVFGNSFAVHTDGAFSWDAWAAGPSKKDTAADALWRTICSTKTYMMGVSPWFYTNLPQWNKNWMWASDTLWFDRWNQVLQMQPDMVEIITWNDYGESHYIGPLHPPGFPAGSERYVGGMSHSSWLDMLPTYIAAYKAGKTSISAEDVNKDQLVYWYRTTPVAAGSCAGTVGNDPAYQATFPVAQMTQDNIYVTALAKSPGVVTVTIGGQAQSQQVKAGSSLLAFPIAGKTGKVALSMSTTGNATTVSGTGADLLGGPPSGVNNFNAYVGGTNTAGPGVMAD